MEQTRIEIYRDGELVETQEVSGPVDDQPVDVLRERLAALEARLVNVDAARIERMEAKITRASEKAEAITPDAAGDPGTRAELGKVKAALSPDEASIVTEDEGE